MQKVVGLILEQLMNQLDPETVKDFVDRGLDALEDKVAKSENSWDDMAVKPLVAAARKILDIEDSRYGSDKVS